MRLKEAMVVSLVLATSSGLLGHGRNSTSVRADVTREAVELRIDAVVLDVLELAGTAAGEWQALPAGARAEALERGARRFAGLVQVVRDGELILPAGQVDIELPDGDNPLRNRMAADQQVVVIRIRYALETPPRKLTFWAAVGDHTAASSIPVQLLLRQDGELVMLPAELGPGALVSREFDWVGKPVSIAELTDLTTVTCSWRNRPANGILEIGGGKAVWRIFIPIEVMQDWLGEDGDGSLEGWEQQLQQLFGLTVDGVDVALVKCGLRVLPVAAHAHSHGSGSVRKTNENQMLEWRMTYPVAASARRIAAVCRSLPEQIPLVYTHIISPAGDTFNLLAPAAPVVFEFQPL